MRYIIATVTNNNNAEPKGEKAMDSIKTRGLLKSILTALREEGEAIATIDGDEYRFALVGCCNECEIEKNGEYYDTIQHSYEIEDLLDEITID